MDPEERRRKWNEWYHKSGKRNHLAGVLKRRSEVREWLQGYKKTLKCNRCEEDHPATLDFHHEDGSRKEYPVSELISRGWSKKRIQEEIEKCEVLCANCHRKHHAEE